MIHHSLVNTIRRDKRFDDFMHPYYGKYSIAELAPTILSLFGVDHGRHILPFDELRTGAAKRVINLVIDGFGYNHFVKYHKRYPFFASLAEKGNIYPITSVFPTTTPAALTTIHTGLTPQEHGLPEWSVYFEEFDSIIATLPFNTWELPEPDGLAAQGGTPEMLYEGPTLYTQLQEARVTSYIFIYEKYAGSTYSRSVHKGSTIVPFRDEHQLLELLLEKLSQEKGPAYFHIYWGAIDATAHEYGPDSEQHIKTIQSFGNSLSEAFIDKLTPEQSDDVLFLMTADHGHVDIKGEDILNLNKYPQIDKNLMKSAAGKRILPTGSPHDVFLFIDPPKIQEVVDFVNTEMAGQATAMTIEEAIKTGFFGLNTPTQKFLRRIGNVIILPHSGYHVWYEFFPDIPYQQRGIHGGLSEDEMFVPLAIARLDDLKQKTAS
jgi:predicted AlkP superfamily pyrophosphatase or phosphodiesterase